MSSWENEQRKEHVNKASFFKKTKMIGEKHYSDTR